MSVVKMKKISICALRKHRKQILEALQRAGVMEIAVEENNGTHKVDTASQKAVFEQRQKAALNALEIIDEYSPQKKSMLDSLKGRSYISQNELDFVSRRQDKIISVCTELKNLKSRIISDEGKIERLKSETEAVEPWLGCDISMGVESTKSADIRFGTVSAAVKEEEIASVLDEYAAEYKIISADKNAKYLALIIYKNDTEAVIKAMRSLGFAKPSVVFDDVPAKHKEKLLKEIEEAKNDILQCEKRIISLDFNRREIRIISDYYGIRAEKYGVLGTLAHTKKTFFVTGYISEKYFSSLKKMLSEKYGAAVEEEEGEDLPVSLENGAFASSFEPVLESFGLPKRKEIDPSAIMGIFYVFLFGLMLSDAAYGAIISVACFVLLKKFKNMEQGMKNALRMFGLCGLSTLFWGIMFGGYFGDAINVISTNFFGKELIIKPLWFAPIDDPMRLLMYSMLFGLIHLFTGLGIKGYMLIKQRDIKGFVYDVLSWFLLIGGLLIILMQSSIYASLAGSALNVGAAVDMAAKAAAIAGALLILFFSGRDSKGFGKRLAKGAYGLYDITSWLSDLLSYSRLLALGLATGVIAQVVNSMGAMAGNGIFGTIVFIAVFIFGHIFNLAINLLGAYVHTNRLQYVEFFGKFYEGGGRKFNPFREKTKFIRVKENE